MECEQMFRNMEYVYEVYKVKCFTKAALFKCLGQKDGAKTGIPYFQPQCIPFAADRMWCGIYPLH